MADKLRNARDLADEYADEYTDGDAFTVRHLAQIITDARREAAEWMRERAKAACVHQLAGTGFVVTVDHAIDAIDVGEMNS